MIVDTAPVPAALEEATAIVEAEWIRLTQEMDGAQRDLAGTHQDLPAPRRIASTVRIKTGVQDRHFPMAHQQPHAMRPAWLKRRVWATERAPPEGWR